MAYTRTSDTTKADQNTKLLADSLDAAINGAVTLYNNQVKAQDDIAENNFQTLVAAGNMSLADQLAYRKTQLSNTQDPATRTTLRTAIATLNAQVNQKAFSDAYTVQLQNSAAGIESIQAVVSWLQGQLATATDQTVKDKINTELITQQTNLFNSVQKTLTDQTTYAKNSGNITTINNQITNLQSAKSTAILNGDTETAATLDLQIQSLQSFIAVNAITTTMQNLATSTVTGSSSANDLLNAYQGQIQSADATTPITIGGTTYASAQAFWTQTRDAYVADQGSSGFFARITKEATDMVNVKASNNTISINDLTNLKTQFATLASNPILAPFAAQLATAQQAALQTAADALTTIVQNNFDQSLDLNTALQQLQAIAATGVNVDKTTQAILNSAAQTQSQAVQSIMTAANNLMAGTPGMTITQAVTAAVAAGAGAIVTNNDLLAKTPAATATDQLTKDQKSAQTGPTSTTITPPAAPASVSTSTTSPTPPASTSYTIKAGDTLTAIAAANNTTVAALAAANNISNPDVIQAGAKIVIPSAVATTPPSQTGTSTPPATTTFPAAAASSETNSSQAPSTATPGQPIDYTLHNGETIAAYTARIAAARGTPVPTPAPATPSTGTGTSNSSSPAPAPATPATPAPSSAAQVIRGSDPYTPPPGLTQTKTTGGGTAYSDKDGNLYVQSTPGVYTLNNSLK